MLTRKTVPTKNMWLLVDDFYNEALDYGICYMQSNMEHSARFCSDDAETQQGLCFAKVSFYRNETAKKCGLPQAYIYTYYTIYHSYLLAVLRYI